MIKVTYKLISFFGIVSFTLLISCSKSGTQSNPPPPVLSSSKDITSFIFKATDNPSLPTDIPGSIGTDSIKFQMYQSISLNGLIPTINLTGKTINPANHTAQNFSTSITYTVTAEDGTAKNYILKVTQVDSATLIQQHWHVIKDSVYDTPGYSNPGGGHPTPGLYIGISSDYYDFNAAGQLSVFENGINYGTTTYQVLPNNKLSIPELDAAYGPGTIEILTANTTIFSWAKTQSSGERYFRRLTLSK